MPPSDGRRALALICAVALGVATNYTNHGPVIGFIQREYALNAGTAGMMATAFFIGAGMLMLAGGALADRLGARTPVTVGFLLTSLSTVGCGLLAPTYPALLAWRFLGGLGGGVAFAAGASYTRQVFAGRGQHLAQGLYGSAFLAGSALPLLYMPLLAGAGGDWQRAYVLSGLATVAIWLAWWRLAPPGTSPRPGQAGGLRTTLRTRNSWLLALSHTCGFGLAMVLGTWVVGYLADEFALPVVLAGALGSLVLVLGIAGRSGGSLALERGVPPLPLIRVGIGLAAVGLATMALAGSLLPAFAGLFATGLGVGLPYAALFNGAAASAPASPGAAQGFVGWGGSMTAIVGPPLVGALLDAGGGFTSGFLALAGFALLVLLATFAMHPISFDRQSLIAEA